MKNRRPLLLLAFLSLLLQVPAARAIEHKTFDYSGKGPELFDYAQVISADGTTVTTRPTSRIPKLLGVSSANVLAEYYTGYSTAGDLLDLSGNSRDLADAGTAPTRVNSSLVGADGNQLQAFSYDGGTGRHQLGTAAWMGVFDGPFAITQLVKTPSTAPGAAICSFSRSEYDVSGVHVTMSTNGTIYAYFNKAGSHATPFSPSTYLDGNYHLIHVVSDGTYGTVFVDGVPGAPVLITGYGVDGDRTMMVGSGGGLYWNSHIAYTRLQNSALTYSQVQKEVGLFQGNLASRAGGQLLLPTFQRATSGTTTGVSTVERRTGTYPIAQVPQNWPVKTSDGAALVEASTTQLFTYTGTFSTNWTKTRSSIAATSVILPDGTTGTANTLHEDGTAANDHSLIYYSSVTSGTSYCESIYIKYNSSASTPREWVKLYLDDGVNSKSAYFNIRYGYSGTVAGTLTGTYGIRPISNGWYRIWVCATSGVTGANSNVLHIAEANNDAWFDGQNQDSVYIAFPQFQTGAFPTSYVAQPAAAGAIRAADNMTFIPWRVSDDLASHVNATPRLLFTGGESLSGATVAPTVGGYSFTKNGRPQNLDTYSEGTSFNMISSDYLSLADSGVGDPFRPSGNFSIVATFTPNTVTGANTLLGKYGSAGNRGYILYQSGSSIIFGRSTNGTNELQATVVSSLEIGKPALVTASYSTTTGMACRVDAFTAATEATTTAIHPTNATLEVGAYNGTSGPMNGKIHYLAYYDGHAIGQAEHDNMYAAFKMDGVLPLNISSTAARKKLVIECEVRGQYASATDNGGQYRSFLSIGGAYGTSSTTRNNFYLQSTANGSSYAVIHTDGSATDRYIYSAVRTDHDKWTRHKWVVDTSDLSLSTYSINGVLQTGFTQMTGTAEFGLRDTLVRFGQGPTGTILGNMEIRNVKLGAE